jgi:hypothetical protein
MTVTCGALIALMVGTSSTWAGKHGVVSQTPLTEASQELDTPYADQLNQLRTELTAKVPQNDQANADTLNEFWPAARWTPSSRNTSSCSRLRLKGWQNSPRREKRRRRWSKRCWRTPAS